MQRLPRKIVFWIGVLVLSLYSSLSVSAEVLNDEDREWLKRHEYLRVGVHPNDPPIEFINEHGEYSGIASEFFAVLKVYTNIELKIEPVPTWEQVIEKARTKEIDMLVCATETPYRKSFLTFTESYIDLPAVIIVRKTEEQIRSINDLAGKSVAVPAGYSLYEYMSRYNMHMVDIPDVKEGIRKVSLGEVDALVANIAIAVYWIEKEGVTNLRVAGDAGFMHRWAFAVRNDMPELKRIADKVLKSIPQKDRISFYRKWVSYSPSVVLFNRREVVSAFIGIAFVLFIVVIVVIWNRVLHDVVEKKTHELRTELEVRIAIEHELEQLKAQLEDQVKRKTGELITAQQQLVRNERLAAMGQVGGLIAHEFRNQLGIMKNVVYFLALRMKNLTAHDTDGKITRHLEILKEQIDETDKIITNILTFARARKPECTALDIKAFLEGIIRKTQERRCAIQILFSIDDGIPPVYADEMQLRQVVENIIINGIDAMKEVGSLTITVSHTDSHVVMSLRDTGCGMSEEVQQKIFEPFYTTKSHGTGLGLATAKNIIEAHGGMIRIESVVGEGTVVTLILPFRPPSV